LIYAWVRERALAAAFCLVTGEVSGVAGGDIWAEPVVCLDVCARCDLAPALDDAIRERIVDSYASDIPSASRQQVVDLMVVGRQRVADDDPFISCGELCVRLVPYGLEPLGDVLLGSVIRVRVCR
jgi:hypothetical protein